MMMNIKNKLNLLKNPKLQNRLTVISSAVLFFAVLFLLIPKEPELKEPPITSIEPQENIFNDLEIKAESAIVYDLVSEKAIFSKNPNQQMPLASVTKVMSAIVASEKGNPDIPVTVTAENTKVGSNAGVRPGDTWRLEDLMKFSLVTSSNGGMRAVASAINSLAKTTDANFDFISEMNITAKRIGLNNTYFINETGLDIGQEEYGGSFSTARDVALMFNYAIKKHPDILKDTIKTDIQKNTLNNIRFTGQNTNQIVNEIPGLIGSKTGYTLTAGGNLAIVFDTGLNEPMVVVVLGSNQADRFSDVKLLVEKSLEYRAKQDK